MLLAGLLAGSIAAFTAAAQTPAAAPAAQPAPAPSAPSATPPAAAPHTENHPPAEGPARFQTNRLRHNVSTYYESVWGVDKLTVKLAESGELVRFSYRVVDADKAKVLNDKKAEPQLIAPAAGVSLVVPTLEKIGQLRQSTTPEEGRLYWMAFSNRGRPVKKGDRVDVVIGHFRAQGLIVE